MRQDWSENELTAHYGATVSWWVHQQPQSHQHNESLVWQSGHQSFLHSLLLGLRLLQEFVAPLRLVTQQPSIVPCISVSRIPPKGMWSQIVVAAPYEANGPLLYLLTCACQWHPMHLHQAWNCGPCTTQAYRLVREFPHVNRVLHPFISIRRMWTLWEQLSQKEQVIKYQTDNTYPTCPHFNSNPFQLRFHPDGFIDSLHSELKSIRTPLQSIPHKGNRHPPQIWYS